MKRDAMIFTLALTLRALGGTMALAKSKSHDVKTGDNGPTLTKITFGGDRYSLLLSDKAAAEGK